MAKHIYSTKQSTAQSTEQNTEQNTKSSNDAEVNKRGEEDGDDMFTAASWYFMDKEGTYSKKSHSSSGLDRSTASTTELDDDIDCFTDLTIDDDDVQAAMARSKCCGIGGNIENLPRNKDASFLQKMGSEVSGSFIDTLVTVDQIWNAFTIEDEHMDMFFHNIQQATDEFNKMRRCR